MNASNLSISRELAGWLQGQLQSGVPLAHIREQLPRITNAPPQVLDQLCSTLQAQGGRLGQAIAGFDARQPRLRETPAPEKQPSLMRQAFDYTHPMPWDGHHQVVLDGHRIDIVARMKRPSVVVLGHVLAPEECAGLIEFAQDRLEAAQVVDPRTGRDYHDPDRTSELLMCRLGETPLIERIEARLTELCGIPLVNGEGLQIMRYKPGAQYRPHFDFFRNTSGGESVHLKRGGQRIATMVMYLNDGAEGGATIFPEIGLDVAPVQGNAVYFAYTDAQSCCDDLSLHGGAPVTAGEKWIATKWFRQGEYRQE